MNEEEIFQISFGEYVAEISTTGAALATLKYAGDDLIEERSHPRYFSGEILAPWPNRIASGRYSYQGREFILEKNEESRGNALHGLVFDRTWNVVNIERTQISLKITIDEPEKYPGLLELQITYNLDAQSLLSTLLATNTGLTKIPYGASTHPYFNVPGLNSVNDYILQIGSSQVLLTDSERLLPTILVDVDKFGFDFRTPRAIGEKFIDHAFKQDPALPREILVTSKSGNGVAITFSETAKWIQIHTADRTGGHNSRKVLAVEPMTCPPDAFNSGIDLIELEPGQSHELDWRIQARRMNA
jgi:aldose 1-epimerase